VPLNERREGCVDLAIGAGLQDRKLDFERKKVSAAFDGGRITSDGGVILLAQAERWLGIADQLARVIR
jgi:hypothetical protein